MNCRPSPTGKVINRSFSPPALPQFSLFCSVCCPIFALKTFLAARPLQKNIFIYSSSSSFFLFFPPPLTF
ncbi:unnamed protein product [Meloidogyne enterolobii]|uniref:Uncharacterized protein n=1 Tax=Meloidogyne enterolobii TaxID=390850 RepID=A0ACB1A2X9_MELEN